VQHTVIALQEEDEAIAMIHDFIPGVGAFSLDEIKFAVDPAGAIVFRRRRRRRPGQEVALAVVLVVDEEAAYRAREQASEPDQQLALVDEVASRLAHATRSCEAARRKTAEDSIEQVVG
jgi:hypothetical protein